MSSGKKNSLSNIVVWIILVLLVVGLGGFGIGNFGGTVRAIGAVGDTEISVDSYARALQEDLRALERQTGQTIPLAQAVALGLAEQTQGRLVINAALDNETARLGISVGDEQVRRQLLNAGSFQGLNGEFDREAYRYFLDQIGMNESEYETLIRTETARTLLQGAVLGGISAPDTMVDTILDYVGARRNFSWVRLGPDALEADLPDPSDGELMAYYTAHPEDFTLPETRRIAYVWLTPAMLIDQIEVDEAELRRLYDQRLAEFVTPERRLVERLVFPDQATAEAAKAEIDAGTKTFEAVVEARGLTLADVDLGDVTEAELGDAGAEVFALDGPGVVGPLPSSLGPALYRMNAVLAAQETTFEQARAQLRDEYAMDSARRQIGSAVNDIDDLFAGGATLEEVADETDLVAGRIDWREGAGEGIAGYDGFREAARSVQEGDFPEVLELDDGGIFALRLEEIVPPTLQPFDDVKPAVIAGWTAQETQKRLAAKADALIAALSEGKTMAAMGLEPQVETDVVRSAFIEGLEPAVLARIFDMQTGEISRFDSLGSVLILRLDLVQPPDTTDADYLITREALRNQAAQSLAQDVFTSFATALRDEAGISINPAAINAVHAQFP